MEALPGVNTGSQESANISLKEFIRNSNLSELMDSKSSYRFPRAALAKMLGVKPWGLNRLVLGGKPPRSMEGVKGDAAAAR